MSKLLHIDSSPMLENSVTRQLSAAFVDQWVAANPGGRVLTRDLYATAIPPIDASWVNAVRTPADQRSDAQAQTLAHLGCADRRTGRSQRIRVRRADA